MPPCSLDCSCPVCDLARRPLCEDADPDEGVDWWAEYRKDAPHAARGD